MDQPLPEDQSSQNELTTLTNQLAKIGTTFSFPSQLTLLPI